MYKKFVSKNLKENYIFHYSTELLTGHILFLLAKGQLGNQTSTLKVKI